MNIQLYKNFKKFKNNKNLKKIMNNFNSERINFNEKKFSKAFFKFL